MAFHIATAGMAVLQIFNYAYGYPTIKAKEQSYSNRYTPLLFTFNLQNACVVIVTIYFVHWAAAIVFG